MTVKSCVAVSPPGSVAVTTILPVEPSPTGATVTLLPDMLTWTINVYCESTEYSSVSLSGSENLFETSICVEGPPT